MIDGPSRRFTLYKWGWGLGAAALQSAIYFLVGNARFERSTELLRTRLDDAIPFIPATAWFYLPIYAGIFVVALACFRTRVHFDRALAGVGVILLGYSFAPLFSSVVDALQRRRTLIVTGLACWALLLVLRGFNIYGENTPWTPQPTTLETVKVWLNFTKYPPSLDILLMTLGGGLLMLAALEFADNGFTQVCASFGGAPMFYYIVHLYVLMVGYRVAFAVVGPNQGTRFGVDADSFWIVWVVWLAVTVLLYWPVKAYGEFKRRTSIAWVKYF